MELFTYVLHSTDIISCLLQKYKRTINSRKEQKKQDIEGNLKGG